LPPRPARRAAGAGHPARHPPPRRRPPPRWAGARPRAAGTSKPTAGGGGAVARRCTTGPALAPPCPLAAGSFGIQGEEGRRLLRVLSFVQHHEKDHPWAHPVDGLVAYVDLIERRVLHLIDQEALPIPEEP